mmetsp:Transcript_90193/g.150788  ORF Transcript_90193/g.150788 Transcript_90193/m.150788 type:complete len:111 (-) Transcript_90193:96-428(-)
MLSHPIKGCLRRKLPSSTYQFTVRGPNRNPKTKMGNRDQVQVASSAVSSNYLERNAALQWTAMCTAFGLQHCSSQQECLHDHDFFCTSFSFHSAPRATCNDLLELARGSL